MAPGKRRQSNAMLYTLITFIGLFIAATTVAVVYYVKAEEYRTTAEELDAEMINLASRDEQRNLGSIIGPTESGTSRLGQMNGYVDAALKLLRGGPLRNVSADDKLKNAVAEVNDIVVRAEVLVDLSTYDPNTSGLSFVTAQLQTKLENTLAEKAGLQQQLTDLQTRFADAIKVMQETEQTLTARKDELMAKVSQIEQEFAQLRTSAQASAQSQVDTIGKLLDDTRSSLDQVNRDLLRTRAELQVSQERMKAALDKVQEVQPAPDRRVLAYKADGRIEFVDLAMGVVHLNIGSDDRVYKGLTFSVYDKAGAMPENGKSKAEVEVFHVEKRVCAAKIINGRDDNPIATGDTVANLIWDSAKANQFVVAGVFDLDRDGLLDFGAPDRIKALIEKWGGVTTDAISAQTDFVILGDEPKIPPQPTIEDLQQDPDARTKYNAAVQLRDRYTQIQDRAQALWIPIFTYDRFLNFTGYVGQVNRPGAF